MPRVAYRAVRSRRKFSKAPEIERGMRAEMERVVKPHFIDAFDEIVADWDHKVDFAARSYFSADEIKLTVHPTGPNKKIWIFVSGGTKPHKIRAKNVPRLAFMWGGPGSYRPKTQPGAGFSGPSFRGAGQVIGGVMHRPMEVQHPGSEPRNFEKWVMDSNRKWFSRTMENAWRRILRAV